VEVEAEKLRDPRLRLASLVQLDLVRPGGRPLAGSKTCGWLSGIISIGRHSPWSIDTSQKLGAPSIQGSTSSLSLTDTAVPSNRAMMRVPGHDAFDPAGPVVSKRPIMSGAWFVPVAGDVTGPSDAGEELGQSAGPCAPSSPPR
jgi:hypothetical protein